MKLALILLLLLSLTHFVMGLFVLQKSRSDWANRYFFGLVLGIIGWLIANYFSNADGLGYTQILLINKAVFIFPVLCAYFALMFSLHFTGLYEKLSQWIIIVLGSFTIFILASSLTNLIVSGVTQSADGVYSIVFGPLSPLYAFYLVSYFGLILPIFILSIKRTKERAAKVRYEYVVAGILISFTLILFMNLVIPLVLSNYAFVGVGPYATLALIGAITYAIVKHRLFEMRALVARSVAYLLLTLILAALYGAVFLAVSILIFPTDGSRMAQSITATALAILLAFTFQPIRKFTDKMTDKFFYHDHYDSQDVLNNFSKILVSELDLDRILKRSLGTLSTDIHIQYAQLAIFDNDRIYRVEHHGKVPDRLMVGPEMKKLDKSLSIADELAVTNSNRELMDAHGIRVALMLRTREQFVGYLLLGDKLSGENYSKQDIELLEIVVKQLAVAILNAKAYIEIQEFNKTLQARVDHATSRIRVANRHLQELDKAKDEFISMASHQLRTPLTTIKGYLSMILDGDAGEITPTQREFVDFAFGASERMVNLISDLLNVSRLSAGRFLIQAKPTDMEAMIRDEVRQLMSHATAKNIELIFTPPTKPIPMVELDENKTRQVVMNFIDNAIYYTKEGNVTLTLESIGDSVRLEVKDTGIGVPEKARKKLFSKFFRAENAQTVRPDGTGLGLYLARRVINDQGGTIIFDSVEGKGSTFGFELPLKAVTQPKT